MSRYSIFDKSHLRESTKQRGCYLGIKRNRPELAVKVWTRVVELSGPHWATTASVSAGQIEAEEYQHIRAESCVDLGPCIDEIRSFYYHCTFSYSGILI